MINRKLSVELFIFDLDGTLIDSKEDIAHCVNLTLQQFGSSPFPIEVIARYVGTGIQPLLRQVFEKNGRDVQQGFDFFDECYHSNLTRSTKLYPGVKETLQSYRDKKKVILTNKQQRFADKIVDTLQIGETLSRRLWARSFLRRKPDPLPILEICKKFKVSPENAAIVGDTEVDIQAGKGAGSITVAALFGYGDSEVLTASQPDLMIQHPSELIGKFS